MSVGSLSFELSQRQAVHAEALRLAARDARSRAEKIADGISVTLRRVRHVRERGAGAPPPPRPYVAVREAAMADAPTPILPQEQLVVGEVEVTYDIE